MQFLKQLSVLHAHSLCVKKYGNTFLKFYILMKLPCLIFIQEKWSLSMCVYGLFRQKMTLFRCCIDISIPAINLLLNLLQTCSSLSLQFLLL